MSIKQEPDTVREDVVDLDCNEDIIIKSVNGKNFPWVKTEHAIKKETSAIQNIRNSLKQCVKQEVVTFNDFSGQEGCCDKTNVLQEKEASAMSGYYHSINCNLTNTYSNNQVKSVEYNEEFTKHSTQTDVSGDIKDIHRGLPVSDDVFLNQQDHVKVYKCGTCSYSSNYLFDLYQHNISHGMDTVYFCDLCQSSYQYFLDLKCHLASHTATCENSSQPFHSRNKFFSEHYTSEKAEQANPNYDPQNNDHNVKFCNHNYTYKLDCEMKWQNESQTGDGNSDVNDISNLQSKKLSDSSASESEQHKYRHSTKELYSCDICEYTSTRYNLKIHKRHHTGEKPYSCDLCSYTCASSSNLKQHRRRHHPGANLYTCDLCSYTCATGSEIKIHKQSHRGKKPLGVSCDLCSYTCARASHLKVHKRCHTGEKPYSCDLCGYTCARASDLKIHKRRHASEKPYSCDLCSYTCASASNLKVHKICHTSEKPYSCDLCGYTCARASDLKLHKRRHTGEKPYTCDLCSSAYITAFDLKVHKRIHTGERPYTCDLCGYTCVTASALKKHKRRWHHT